MKRYYTLAALVLAAFSGTAAGMELVTPSYQVIITENCPEGDVSCQDVSYAGTSKRTGKSIELKGHSVSRMCADGVTPCQHLGYKFVNGAYEYFVSDDGTLTVTRGDKVIVDEKGEWAD